MQPRKPGTGPNVQKTPGVAAGPPLQKKEIAGPQRIVAVPPPPYRPNATRQAMLAAPPVYRVDAGIPRPVPRPATAVSQMKTAGRAGASARQSAPPVYRPLPARARSALQRAQPIPGFPGFHFGSLSSSQQHGTFNTTWSQTETPTDYDTVAHSSAKLSKGATSHLVDFADIEHLANEENTHAEDKLAAYVHQLVAESRKTGIVNVTIPEFFVSASPCSSTFETSGKSTGCTENLIAWHESGINFSYDEGCAVSARITITHLVVDHLYKGNNYAGANGSYAALKLLKKKGVIGGWHINKMPGLTEFQGNQDS